MSTPRKQQSGFTLVEMIMVMVITGIIGGMVAIFIRAPVQSYVDSARRAEMTDIADTALRRLARDIRTAVPNSIRTAICGGVPCVEFLPTRDGGRYRANAPGNPLSFGIVDGSFAIIGTAINLTAGATPDFIVVGSTQSDGNPPYNTTAAGILRAYTGPTGAQTTVTFTATALPLWAELPSQRFDVVDGTQQAVTYACEGLGIDANGDGTGSLNRYAAYGFNVAQATPAAMAGLGVVPAVLADRLSACAITYNAVTPRNALLEITLSITRGNETVSLYQSVHVTNMP